MDKRLVWIGAAIGIGVVLWVVSTDISQPVRPGSIHPGDLASVDDNDTVTATFATGDQDLTLELVAAVSPGSRRRGLMNRTTIPRDGMLFIYDTAAPRSFWMKDTLIPLDMVFVSGDNRVVTIHQADPEPVVSTQDLTRYRSTEPAQFVIETRQGVMARNNVSVGDIVRFAVP